MLYIPVDYLIPNDLHCPLPYPCVTLPPTLSQQQLLIFLSLWVCFFFDIHCFLYFLDSTYKWHRKVFVFLCLTYFTYIMPSNPIHVVANGKISFFFFAWVVFCSIYVPLLFYAFICSWTLRLLPYLGNCKLC